MSLGEAEALRYIRSDVYESLLAAGLHILPEGYVFLEGKVWRVTTGDNIDLEEVYSEP